MMRHQLGRGGSQRARLPRGVGRVCGLESLRSTSGGDILIANSSSPGAAGWTTYPSTSPSAGDIWFDADYQTSFHVALHEIGHAVGLKHPHDGSTNLPVGLDHTDFTHMSYNGNFFETWAGPALLDILAIQHLYGADKTTRSGDTVYSFPWSADTPGHLGRRRDGYNRCVRYLPRLNIHHRPQSGRFLI